MTNEDKKTEEMTDKEKVKYWETKALIELDSNPRPFTLPHGKPKK